MSASLEDRLRSYYRDRTDREALPPDQDGAADRLGSVLAEGDKRRVRPIGGRAVAPVRLAAVAALVLAVLGVSLVVVATRHEEADPSTGPDPDGEEDEAPTPSTPPPTTPSTSTSTPTTTAGPPAGTGRTSVVGPWGELGTWDGDAWVRSGSDGWDPTPPGERYQVVTLDGAVTEATSEVGTDCSPEGRDRLDVGIEWGDELSSGGIGVTGVADPTPRPVELLDPAAEAYRTATREVLAGLGVEDPDPDVTQVVRTDVDGDGTGEVLVAARRLTDPSLAAPAPGDYGVVFVRRVVAGEVVTQVLESYVTTEGEPWVEEYAFTAVADLNGDGRTEVAINVRVWEGVSTAAYELGADGTFAQVLSGGCGV